MNTILKRKLSDTLSLNNISKKLKHTKPTPDIHIKQSSKTNDIKHNNKQHNHHNNHYNNHNHNHNYVSGKVYVASRKEPIPKRLREVVWNTYNGDKYSSKCHVTWCNNIINVFNYQVGHDIPESKGGSLDIENLKPICGNCNLSMGNKYTITEWSKLIPTDSKHYIPKTDTTIQESGICNNILEELQKNDSYIKINKTVKKINKMLEKKHLAGNVEKPILPDITTTTTNTDKHLIEDKPTNKTHESVRNVTVIALLLIALQMILG
jgi:5-methylcytosine-specific restriction endonuclease McrA